MRRTTQWLSTRSRWRSAKSGWHCGAAAPERLERPAGQPRIVLLSAEADGRIRTAAESLRAALVARHGSNVSVGWVDLLGHPYRRLLPKLLARFGGPLAKRSTDLWGFLFHATNFPSARWIAKPLSRWTLRPAIEQILSEE